MAGNQNKLKENIMEQHKLALGMTENLNITKSMILEK